MKSSVKNGIVMLATLAMAAYISQGIQAGESGLLLWVFMAFVGLIIVFQLVAGLSLFVCMLKGLFSTHAQRSDLATPEKSKK